MYIHPNIIEEALTLVVVVVLLVVVVVVLLVVVVVLLEGDEKVGAFVKGGLEDPVAFGPLVVSVVEGADNWQVIVMIIDRK